MFPFYCSKKKGNKTIRLLYETFIFGDFLSL